MTLSRGKLFLMAGVGVIVVVPMLFWLLASRGDPLVSFTEEFEVRRGVIDSHISARGRVEGLHSQEIKLAARTFGRIRAIRVSDGDRVKKNQVVAVLENEDSKARVEEARAQWARSQAALERLLKGARPEEREARRAEMAEAQALAENAAQQHERARQLFESGGIVSQAALDRAQGYRKAAEARLASARERYKLIMAPPRSEDVAAARADVQLANARLRGAQDYLDNTIVRSPVDGVVVKRFMNPGEAIAYEALSRPILSVSDTSKLMVRAEIDETDIGKIKLGQKASITADAFPGRSFTARVVRISGGMGKKEILTDNPMDKVDTEILETFLELEPDAPLRVGLRVDLYIQLEYRNDALVVPIRAVLDEEGTSKVRVRTGKGIERRSVRLGMHDGMLIEIVAGLDPGEVVVY